MFSGKKLIISVISLIIINNLTLADWKNDSKVIGISGGENYTLFLTQNQWLWACGDNWYYQLGIGEDIINQFSPVRVHNGDMPTESGYLEYINNFDAGFKHSLAIDVNRFVWAWGNKIVIPVIRLENIANFSKNCHFLCNEFGNFCTLI